MKYGLIGEHLGHSFSKVIHEKIGDYVYEIKEIEPENVEKFIAAREFCAINVTIPYKEKVMPMLDYIDEKAKKIGAVNTVVNRGGKLYGYNTDYDGMTALVKKVGAEIDGKKVLIVGTGGTSKTAKAVTCDLGAKEIIFVSNAEASGAISYEELYKNHTDIEVIFNTSPVGMYPNNYNSPLDIDKFPKLSAVIDAVYNPLRTQLVMSAKNLGLKSEGGLYMLVSQAVYAYEHFMDKEISKEIVDEIYSEIVNEKSNIVLIGMPSSGKTTVGKLLAQELNRPFFDLDEEIVRVAGRTIPEIFATDGEVAFRDLETRVLRELFANQKGIVLATGGGAVLRDENVDFLRRNGKIYFIDRPLEDLMPTSDRPLASSREAICRRYEERYERYCQTADCHIDGKGSVEEVAARIRKDYETL